ncbi:GM16737 [Drosophila sechellia]|uniref:GM16737 n=1 Tax=Drosophila sechellia TaxID=7238 RepID=B4ICW2_DROSE|nr:GM16737 [Drosophila sechellia]
MDLVPGFGPPDTRIGHPSAPHFAHYFALVSWLGATATTPSYHHPIVIALTISITNSITSLNAHHHRQHHGADTSTTHN